jgi:hypothetical protein
MQPKFPDSPDLSDCRRYAASRFPDSRLPQSLFRFDRIETGLWILDLTRFLDANRPPLRLENALMSRQRDGDHMLVAE